MKNLILRYLDGDMFAKDILLDEIMELHNYKITKHEAGVLLQSKYGKA